MQKRILNAVIVWVSLSFVGDQLALWTICLPVTQYWAVPVQNPQCASYQYYQIVNAVFNITTDVLLLLIGLPPVLKARLSIQQKVILSIVFGMGSFVVIAALLRAIYCTVPALVSYVYMNWYFREATVAILVTNLPLIWSLLRDVFPALKSWTGGSKRGTDRYKSGPWTSKGSRPYGPPSQLRSGDFDMQNFPHRSTVATPQKNGSAVSDVSLGGGSDERDMSSDDGSARALRIRQDITVTVQHDSRPPDYQTSTAHVTQGHEEV